jgi:aminoglycoside 3-N-acetyltransferase I
MSTPIEIRRLSPAHVSLVPALNAMFGAAFGDPEQYVAAPPDEPYLYDLLGKEHVIVLAAMANSDIVGGLVAYELDKIERARREIYIYDLAVAVSARRRGIATAMIQHLKDVARARRAWVIYVQADYGDEPALALYGSLGVREEVLHYDIGV